MDLRSEVLRNSLYTEHGVNGLLLSYLAIFDKERTKNFGNKAGISFKSKIDLLFDLNILSKEEHFNLELQMMFRNKFLHDLEFNSFTYAISKIDNGIIKKLKNFKEDDEESDTEEKYRTAYSNLYYHNTQILADKFDERIGKVKKKKIFINGLTESLSASIDLSFDLVSDICRILENSELEISEISELSNSIMKRCKEFTTEMESNSVMKNNRKVLNDTTDQELIDLLK